MSVMATSFVEAMTESDSSPKVVLPISVPPHVDASAHEFSKYIYIMGAPSYVFNRQYAIFCRMRS